MKKNKWIALILLAALCLPLLCACSAEPSAAEDPFLTKYKEKAELLKPFLFYEGTLAELGSAPAQGVGNAVFLSVTDSDSRAHVFHGSGKTLEDAWNAADAAAQEGLAAGGLDPIWVKADVLFYSERVPADKLSQRLENSKNKSCRYGLSLDESFSTALLEEELNAAGIYDYDKARVDIAYLNEYLTRAGRDRVETLPEEYIIFRCFGWLCDEALRVYPLKAESLNAGRRGVDALDGSYALGLVNSGTRYILKQQQADGSFSRSSYPAFDEAENDYNMYAQARAISALLDRYELEQSQELHDAITRGIDRLLADMVYPEGKEDIAYLLDAERGEIRLQDSAHAITVLCQYTEAFASEDRLESARHLGKGILSMIDPEMDQFVHVLHSDFTIKEAQRDLAYDGVSAYALCRLYSLTGERPWLTAAEDAVSVFMRKDYAQYKDPWVSYAVVELTKYVYDNPNYFAFGLRNAMANLDAIYEDEAVKPEYLELLLVCFELYDKLVTAGATVDGFDMLATMDTVYHRAERILEGYFFPEFAMYMQAPQNVLGAFMNRQEDFRIYVDEVADHVDALYLYYKNYDRLVSYGIQAFMA